jgi:penicillin-binding protein 1A
MNYNKNSTGRRLDRADSKKTKAKNKAFLTGLKIFMVLFIIVVIIGGSAIGGVARGIIDSAPDITNLDV